MRAASTAALIVASTALSLIVLEIGARLFAPPSARFPFPALFRPSADPEIGYELRPDLDETAYGSVVRTNSLGFRDPERGAKDAAVFRIAAVGDSITFGYGVADAEPWPRRLEALLNERCTGRRFEVLNMGVMGYTTAQALATLPAKVLPLDPDLVVHTFVSNDVDATLAADADGFLHWDTAGSDHTLARHSQIFRALPVPFAPFLRAHSVLFNFIELRVNQLWVRFGLAPPAARLPARGAGAKGGRYNAGLTPRQILDSHYLTYSFDALEPWAQIDAALGRAQSLLATRGIGFLVAAFDTPGFFLKRMLELRDAHGYAYVGFPYAFGGAGNYASRFSLGWDLHPNPEAHERMAEVVYAKLQSGALIDEDVSCAPGLQRIDWSREHADDLAAFEGALERARAEIRAPAIRLRGKPAPGLVRGVRDLEEFRRLVVLVRAPRGERPLTLEVTGSVPAGEGGTRALPLRLTARANGVALGAVSLPSEGPLSARWRLDAPLPASGLLEVALSVERSGSGTGSGAVRVGAPARVQIDRIALAGAR